MENDDDDVMDRVLMGRLRGKDLKIVRRVWAKCTQTREGALQSSDAPRTFQGGKRAETK